MTYAAWAAGDRITAARLNAMVGVWTDYTCTWGAASGTTTLGDGTLVARYMQLGNLIHFRIRLQWGTTTTQSVSGANWTFTLPATLSSPNGTTDQPVMAWIMDSSASFTRTLAAGYADNPSGTSMVETIVATGTASVTDNTTPMVWANGDRLNIWGTYEAA